MGDGSWSVKTVKKVNGHNHIILPIRSTPCRPSQLKLQSAVRPDEKQTSSYSMADMHEKSKASEAEAK